MENTDFVIEHIDEEVQVIADQPSVVTNYPANTDFFIENIDSNVISIAHSLNIEASEVNFRPANTDFFIENIDKNVIAIAESMNLSPSEVDFRPANTDFFVENIDKNLIKIAESLSLTPYEVSIRPANTDMFIENIDKNVTLIKGSTNVVTVSGEYININLPDGGKVQSAQLNGNATQTTYSGKNLFDIATATLVNKYVNTSGGMTSASDWVGIESFFEVQPNTTYTFSAKNQGERFLWGEYATASGSDFISPRHESTGTFTTGSSTHYIRFSTNNANATDLQIERGSTATSYEPYVGGTASPNPDYPQEIQTVTGEQTVKVVGKNLWDSQTAVSYSNTSRVFIYDNEWLQFETGNYRLKYPLKVDSGQAVSFQATVKSTVDSQNVIVWYFVYEDGTTEKLGEIVLTDQNEHQFIASGTPIKNVVEIRTGYTSGRYARFKLDTIQLELGSTATEFEPYQGQSKTIDLDTIELAKIGTYQDRIYKDGEKWYVEKQVGKVVLDGTETWNLQNMTAGKNYYTMISTANGGSQYPIMNNMGTFGRFDSSTPSIAEGECFISPSKNLNYFANTFSDTNALKTALGLSPMVVYYTLATPTTTEITNQTLIDQLEALASATLNQGVNNIWIEIATGNAMPTLELVIEKY